MQEKKDWNDDEKNNFSVADFHNAKRDSQPVERFSVVQDRYESVEGGINMQEGPVYLIRIDIKNPKSLRTKVTVTIKVHEKN